MKIQDLILNNSISNIILADLSIEFLKEESKKAHFFDNSIVKELKELDKERYNIILQEGKGLQEIIIRDIVTQELLKIMNYSNMENFLSFKIEQNNPYQKEDENNKNTQLTKQIILVRNKDNLKEVRKIKKTVLLYNLENHQNGEFFYEKILFTNDNKTTCRVECSSKDSVNIKLYEQIAKYLSENSENVIDKDFFDLIQISFDLQVDSKIKDFFISEFGVETFENQLRNIMKKINQIEDKNEFKATNRF